ncbi:hypothetical protein CANCADRAFT_45587 [Tortispora caseinolytica NRRL Y-17796]|uniref:Lysosomal cobalamin transporter n=1 Tax=Tortispora caseinolytica NRRL Y-17796 TaxID=767744 RepID=A0A1E4TBK0_9ASCO|nr:hypothetical protein CANCADRAFT_45587 [Tortispora caseinolytica NRRL Y-17796]
MWVWLLVLLLTVISILLGVIICRIIEDPQDRSLVSSCVASLCFAAGIITTSLLTIDVFVIGSTVDSSTGLRKPWASDSAVESITAFMEVLYYSIILFDAFLVTVAVPFAYFWYEETYEQEDQDQSNRTRLRSSLKYTVLFLIVIGVAIIIAVIVGLSQRSVGRLIGALLILSLLAFWYTSDIGLLLGPLRLVHPKPIDYSSAEDEESEVGETTSLLESNGGHSHTRNSTVSGLIGVSESTKLALALNREKQRAIEMKHQNVSDWSARDRRAYSTLQREEKTLMRKARTEHRNFIHARVEEENSHSLFSTLNSTARSFIGVIGLLISLFMLISIASSTADFFFNKTCDLTACSFEDWGARRAKLRFSSISTTRDRLLYPMNSIVEIIHKSSGGLYAGAAVQAIIILWLTLANTVGVTFTGIRLLFFRIFKVGVRQSPPQAVLLSSVLMITASIAVLFISSEMLFPTFTMFGGQTVCMHTAGEFGEIRDCSVTPEAIIPCSQAAAEVGFTKIWEVCTLSRISVLSGQLAPEGIFGPVAIMIGISCGISVCAAIIGMI